MFVARVSRPTVSGKTVDENVSAFTRFPEELWLVIIRYIDDPVDYHNLMLTSVQLQGLMEERRTTHLFGAILKNVSVYFTECKLNSLRLVCKKWKRAIDAHYEMPFELNLLPSPLVNPHPARFGPMNVGAVLHTIARIEEVRRAVTQQPNEYCPFPGRQLTIKCGEDDEFTFWQEVSQLLGLVGHWIRHLRITYFRLNPFINCLNELPNLESVHLIGHPDGITIEGSKSYEYLTDKPTRHFPFLRVLTFEFDVPFGVAQYLYETHALQLTHLARSHFYIHDVNHKYPNLTRLKCKVSLDRLAVLPRALPRITELDICVYLSFHEMGSSACHQELLWHFQNFPSTLNKLSLRVDASSMRSSVRLNLPNLVELTVENARGNPNFDPFLTCTNLQRLWLVGCVSIWALSNFGVVEFESVDGKMRTDIWNYLPNLESFFLPIPFASFHKPI